MRRGAHRTHARHAGGRIFLVTRGVSRGVEDFRVISRGILAVCGCRGVRLADNRGLPNISKYVTVAQRFDGYRNNHAITVSYTVVSKTENIIVYFVNPD